MTYTFKENIDINEYQEFITNSSNVSFMQNPSWANVKSNWISFRPGLYHNKKLVAVCLFLVRTLSKGILMGYVPRGYVIDFKDKELLQEFTKGIKNLAKKNHCYVVKIDPNFCFHETSILTLEKGEMISIPQTFSIHNQEYHQNLLSLKYHHKGYPKAIGKTLQPRYNMMIPLVNEKLEPLTEEEVLKSFKKRIRSYLGKYHKNRGVFYEHTSDKHKLDDFIDILKSTEDRQGIHLRSKEYFEKIMDNYQKQAILFFGKLDLNIYLSFLEKNSGKAEEIDEVRKLIEEGNDILTLSAALVIMPTNQTGIRVSEYLYAGNRLLFNKLQLSIGLVYDICKYSIQEHCTYCNLGGIDGNLTDHLSTYKSRFNSIVMEFAGEYDLPINKLLYYPIDFFLPILKKGYYLIKK